MNNPSVPWDKYLEPDRVVLGDSSHDMTTINLAGINKVALENDANPTDILSAVMVHELLGHDLERAVTGETGKLFSQYFEYSQDRIPGHLFESIHWEIDPRDLAGTGSKPTMEYGWVNASEDLATAAEASVADAMGWTESMNKIERMAMQLDPYRRDLILNLFQQASSSGFVGSELSYSVNDDGETVGVEPARKLELTVTDAKQAIEQELQLQTQQWNPPEELKVYRSQPQHGTW